MPVKLILLLAKIVHGQTMSGAIIASCYNVFSATLKNLGLKFQELCSKKEKNEKKGAMVRGKFTVATCLYHDFAGISADAIII